MSYHKKMLQVGEVSRKLGVNPQTLYFYERIGLIPPPKRTSSGYRLFSERDIERLAFITQTKALGLTLDEIKEILMFQDGKLLTCSEFKERFSEKVQKIEANIRQLISLRDQLLPLIDLCQANLDSSSLSGKCPALDTLADKSQDSLLS